MINITEDAFMSQLIGVARLCGWKVAHFRPARTKGGWRTPVAADGQGFPDLLLARERIVVAELKAEKGREAHVWRPSDFDDAITVLRRRERTGS